MESKKYSVTIESTNYYFKIIDIFCANKLKENNNTKLSFIEYDEDEMNDDFTKLIYGIQYGNYELNFKDKTIYVTKRKIGESKGTNHKVDVYRELLLETNDSKELLDDFLKSCYDFNKVQPKQDKVNVFKWGTYWSKLSSLEKRSLDTIYLDDIVLNDMLLDIKNFQNEKNVYKKYGIPYKKNYLFSGLPGTGKTSLIFSLASEINYSIYLIPFTLDINDNIFTNALRGIEKNSILVLEDVDALFVKRDTQSKSLLSFSGLINILDGLARKEGLIVFLTTNHVEKLDNALIRPGRIDKYIEFTYATDDQIKKMFKKFVPDQINNMDKFMNKINGVKTTTAILQKFFFENRHESDVCTKKTINKLKQLCKSYIKDDSKLNSLYA